MKRSQLWYFRCAATGLCLLLGVLLIGLWARSYYVSSKLTLRSDEWLAVLRSFKGELSVRISSSSRLGFQELSKFQFPYLLTVMLAITLAALPWVQWSRRFSLRALLIVAMLIAVFFGLIMSN